MIKKLMPIALTAMLSAMLSTNALAEVTFFMEQTTAIQPKGHVWHGTYNPIHKDKYPDGKYPFLGKMGFQFVPNSMPNFYFNVGYMHRSNWDKGSYEYSYNAPFVSMGVKSNCLWDCPKK